jgi:hypothetical protein
MKERELAIIVASRSRCDDRRSQQALCRYREPYTSLCVPVTESLPLAKNLISSSLFVT